MTMSGGGQVLSDFIRSRRQPRNQVATLSGLTNTYIRNLENNDIANVPRARLIAVGVALNLDLGEIDTLLAAFDRTGLTQKDIPAFISTAQNAKLSEAVLPIRNFSLYEMILLSMEQAPGRQIIVNDKPTASLMAQGHRTHKDREILSRHPIYGALNEAIGRARHQNLTALLKNHQVDHYICRRCLEDYLSQGRDDAEKSFRYAHVLALKQTLDTCPNFHLFITRSCFSLQFTLKLGGPGNGNDKLSYSSAAPHGLYRGKRGRLMGFITENPVLCNCFKEELRQVEMTVEIKERQEQIRYLSGLLSPVETRLNGQSPI